MNIRDLRYAVAVAEQGHFGRAAAICNVSQPALSGQVRKLEQHLGVALFERTKRSVRVTAAGEELIDEARSVLDAVARLEMAARSLSDPFSGPLRLGMIPTIGPYLTPRLVPALAHALPRVDLTLVEATTAELETKLLAGDIDAALLATPVDSSRLDAIALYEEPFWVALPKDHPLAAADEIDVARLEADDLLLLADGHCLRDQVLSFCRSAFDGNPDVNTLETSLETILALVGSGAGVTLVPAMGLGGSWVTDSGIAMRREKSGGAARSVSLVFRRVYPRRRLIDKLADVVCAIVPDTVKPERR